MVKSLLKEKLAELNEVMKKAATSEQFNELYIEKIRLLNESIDLLYQEFGYEMVFKRVSSLKALEGAKKLSKQLEEELYDK